MKNKKILFSVFLCYLLIPVYAQTSVELIPSETIKIIGTQECFNYLDNNGGGVMSTTVNTASNLFDNDLDTYFATFQRSYGWAGLDLGSKYVITKVSYCPADIKERLQLGVFEGANNPDFGDAVPFLVVKEIPDNDKLTEEAVSCSRGFRYVRYVGPSDSRCKLSELKFFGYESEGDDSQLYRVTNLPTVSIHTKNAEDIVDDKDRYRQGIVSVISTDGIHTDSLDIRGRGNASWEFPKKPYRMKLYEKARLLGLPANEKNWTLINNYGDKTLMRNLLAFDISKRLEMTYTPAGTPVDVFLNGEYKGCYQLCDHLQIKKGRVDIDELKVKDATSLEKITGGYLIEIDAYSHQEAEIERFDSKLHNIPVTIGKSLPDGTVDELRPFKNYIKNHFDLLEETLFGQNFLNAENGYRKYLDTESFLRHFLVGEISGNTDTYWSTYMYKKRGDDIFYTGPVWDFDIAFENDDRTYPINTKTTRDWLYKYSGSSAAKNMQKFVNRIFTDPKITPELKEIYAYYRNQGAISADAIIKVIDDYEAELEESQKLNFIRWKIMNKRVHQNPYIHGSYEAEVQNVRKYIQDRIAWIDVKLDYKPTNTSSGICNKLSVNVRTNSETLYISGVNSKTTLTIFDLSGKLIESEIIYNDISKKLNKGSYIINLQNNTDNTIQNFKCIIL